MLSILFESQERRAHDAMEIRSLIAKYGDEAKQIVRARADDDSLSDRDRKHWRRIARKI